MSASSAAQPERREEHRSSKSKSKSRAEESSMRSVSPSKSRSPPRSRSRGRRESESLPVSKDSVPFASPEAESPAGTEWMSARDDLDSPEKAALLSKKTKSIPRGQRSSSSKSIPQAGQEEGGSKALFFITESGRKVSKTSEKADVDLRESASKSPMLQEDDEVGGKTSGIENDALPTDSDEPSDIAGGGNRDGDMGPGATAQEERGTDSIFGGSGSPPAEQQQQQDDGESAVRYPAPEEQEGPEGQGSGDRQDMMVQEYDEDWREWQQSQQAAETGQDDGQGQGTGEDETEWQAAESRAWVAGHGKGHVLKEMYPGDDDQGFFPSQETHDAYFASDEALQAIGPDWLHYDAFMQGKGKAAYEIEEAALAKGGGDWGQNDGGGDWAVSPGEGTGEAGEGAWGQVEEQQVENPLSSAGESASGSEYPPASGWSPPGPSSFGKGGPSSSGKGSKFFGSGSGPKGGGKYYGGGKSSGKYYKSDYFSRNKGMIDDSGDEDGGGPWGDNTGQGQGGEQGGGEESLPYGGGGGGAGKQPAWGAAVSDAHIFDGLAAGIAPVSPSEDSSSVSQSDAESDASEAAPPSKKRKLLGQHADDGSSSMNNTGQQQQQGGSLFGQGGSRRVSTLSKLDVELDKVDDLPKAELDPEQQKDWLISQLQRQVRELTARADVWEQQKNARQQEIKEQNYEYLQLQKSKIEVDDELNELRAKIEAGGMPNTSILGAPSSSSSSSDEGGLGLTAAAFPPGDPHSSSSATSERVLLDPLIEQERRHDKELLAQQKLMIDECNRNVERAREESAHWQKKHRQDQEELGLQKKKHDAQNERHKLTTGKLSEENKQLKSTIELDKSTETDKDTKHREEVQKLKDDLARIQKPGYQADLVAEVNDLRHQLTQAQVRNNFLEDARSNQENMWRQESEQMRKAHNELQTTNVQLNHDKDVWTADNQRLSSEMKGTIAIMTQMERMIQTNGLQEKWDEFVADYKATKAGWEGERQKLETECEKLKKKMEDNCKQHDLEVDQLHHSVNEFRMVNSNLEQEVGMFRKKAAEGDLERRAQSPGSSHNSPSDNGGVNNQTNSYIGSAANSQPLIIDNLKGQLNQVRQEYELLNERYQNAKQESDKHYGNLRELDKKWRDEVGKTELLSQTLKFQEHENSFTRKKLERMEREFEDTQRVKVDLEVDKKTLKRQLDDRLEEIANIDMLKTEHFEALRNLQEVIDDRTQDMDKADKSLQRLREENKLEREGAQRVVAELEMKLELQEQEGKRLEKQWQEKVDAVKKQYAEAENLARKVSRQGSNLQGQSLAEKAAAAAISPSKASISGISSASASSGISHTHPRDRRSPSRSPPRSPSAHSPKKGSADRRSSPTTVSLNITQNIQQTQFNIGGAAGGSPPAPGHGMPQQPASFTIQPSTMDLLAEKEKECVQRLEAQKEVFQEDRLRSEENWRRAVAEVTKKHNVTKKELEEVLRDLHSHREELKIKTDMAKISPQDLEQEKQKHATMQAQYNKLNKEYQRKLSEHNDEITRTQQQLAAADMAREQAKNDYDASRKIVEQLTRENGELSQDVDHLQSDLNAEAEKFRLRKSQLELELQQKGERIRKTEKSEEYYKGLVQYYKEEKNKCQEFLAAGVIGPEELDTYIAEKRVIEDQCKLRVEQITDDRNKITKDFDHARADLQRTERNLMEREQLIAELEQKVKDGVSQAHHQQLVVEMANMKDTCEQAVLERREAKEECSRLKTELNALKQKQNPLYMQIENINTYQREREEAVNALKAMEEQMSAMTKEKEKLQGREQISAKNAESRLKKTQKEYNEEKDRVTKQHAQDLQKKDKELTSLQLSFAKSSKELEVCKKELDAAKSELKGGGAAADQLRKQLEETREEAQRVLEQKEAAHKATVAATKEKFDKMRTMTQNAMEAKGKIKEQELEALRLVEATQELVDNLEAEKTELLTKHRALDHAIAEGKKEKTEMANKLKGRDGEMVAFQTKIAALEKQKEALETKAARLDGKLADLANLEGEKKELEKKVLELRNDVSGANAQIGGLKAGMEGLKKKMEEDKAKFAEINKAKGTGTAAIQIQQEEEHKKDMEHLKKEIEELENEIASSKAQVLREADEKRKEVETLMDVHKKEKKALQEEHNKKLTEQRTKHEAKVDELSEQMHEKLAKGGDEMAKKMLQNEKERLQENKEREIAKEKENLEVEKKHELEKKETELRAAYDEKEKTLALENAEKKETLEREFSENNAKIQADLAEHKAKLDQEYGKKTETMEAENASDKAQWAEKRKVFLERCEKEVKKKRGEIAKEKEKFEEEKTAEHEAKDEKLKEEHAKKGEELEKNMEKKLATLKQEKLAEFEEREKALADKEVTLKGDTDALAKQKEDFAKEDAELKENIEKNKQAGEKAQEYKQTVLDWKKARVAELNKKEEDREKEYQEKSAAVEKKDAELTKEKGAFEVALKEEYEAKSKKLDEEFEDRVKDAKSGYLEKKEQLDGETEKERQALKDASEKKLQEDLERIKKEQEDIYQKQKEQVRKEGKEEGLKEGRASVPPASSSPSAGGQNAVLVRKLLDEEKKKNLQMQGKLKIEQGKGEKKAKEGREKDAKIKELEETLEAKQETLNANRAKYMKLHELYGKLKKEGQGSGSPRKKSPGGRSEKSPTGSAGGSPKSGKGGSPKSPPAPQVGGAAAASSSKDSYFSAASSKSPAPPAAGGGETRKGFFGQPIGAQPSSSSASQARPAASSAGSPAEAGAPDKTSPAVKGEESAPAGAGQQKSPSKARSSKPRSKSRSKSPSKPRDAASKSPFKPRDAASKSPSKSKPRDAASKSPSKSQPRDAASKSPSKPRDASKSKSRSPSVSKAKSLSRSPSKALKSASPKKTGPPSDIGGDTPAAKKIKLDPEQEEKGPEEKDEVMEEEAQEKGAGAEPASSSTSAAPPS